jgi:ABC-type uncharacterized transport system fused permease/ATPase subunit
VWTKEKFTHFCFVLLPSKGKNLVDFNQKKFNDTQVASSEGITPVEDDAVIRTVKLNKFFGDKHVLKDIDFEVRRKEVVALIGPSSSGKNTLIRCLLYRSRLGFIVVWLLYLFLSSSFLALFARFLTNDAGDVDRCRD